MVKFHLIVNDIEEVFDKDVWCAWGSSDQILEKWNLLYEMIMK